MPMEPQATPPHDALAHRYDLAVVGGGHAGCEAALAAARLGLDTLLVTGALDRIAAMSCNPAIGGVGKGHLVKEIDALGGEMARVADRTGIQFRTLNNSRGPAVRATRCQSDMERYRQEMARIIWAQPGLTLLQDEIVGLRTDDSGEISGLTNKHGMCIHARRIIRDAVESGEAPLFNGQLEGTGPRYCPSVEDKVIRFPEKTSHLIFLEPHGLDTPEIYPNGLSTSLPPHIQLEFLRTLSGLEDVLVTRWGYAVEYDFVHPTQLFPSLETKSVPGLYTAGQINGTTGYEEAAMQGLLAGINAARSLKEKEPVVLSRHQAYGGVLVDDLVTLGTEEPYRMFTSRAEHRLILREDNAHARLMELGYGIGLLEASRYQSRKDFEEKVSREIRSLVETTLLPNAACNALLQKMGSPELKVPTPFAQLIKRPEIGALAIPALRETLPSSRKTTSPEDSDPSVLYRAAIELKYEGYIKRAEKEIERERSLEEAKIPETLFQSQLPGMSNEVFEKLRLIRPQTLAHASRISGVTPAAVGLLAVEVRKLAALQSASAPSP
jgi:tRNA U34 5-carboxymethylaminomethyl modifying enzyme MnmG/GidA